MVSRILLLFTVFLCFSSVISSQDIEKSANLKLKFVQIVTRHGARSALNPLPVENVVWDCSLVNLGVSVVGQSPAPVLYRKKYINNRQVLPGDCAAGALTPEGWQNHLTLGGHFRTRYVDALGFLPSNLNDSLLFVRSTDSPRTIASVQANLLGLYPTDNRSPSDMVDIYTIDAATEDLLPPTNCGKLNNACDKVQNDSAWKNNDKSLEPIGNKLKNAWNVTALPWWVGLWDNLHARKFHSLPFPPQIDQKTYSILEKAVLFQLKALYRPDDVKKYAIGRFLAELSGAMDSFLVGGLGPLRYIHYSAHDLTVALLLSSLDVLDSVSTWPKFAASIQFELWNDANNATFVKVLYNLQEIKIPKCQSHTTDPFLCPLAVFKSIISKHIPLNYVAECNSVQPTGVSSDVTKFLC